MAARTASLLQFITYRFIYAADRTAIEVQEELNISRERALAILRRLEFAGFIYRKRTKNRKNGITYAANKIPVGEVCHYTAVQGMMLPS